MNARTVPVGRRIILADRRRLMVSVVGVGAAIGLIFLLQALWTGFQGQISAYPDNVGADLFVAEPGTRNLLGDTSVLPIAAAQEVAAIEGVTGADPLLARFSILDFDGHKRVAFLLGSRPDARGGPWQLADGRSARSDNEVVLDRVLAKEHNLVVGDDLKLLGRRLRIVGLSEGTRSWMAGLVFVTHDAAEGLLGAAGTTSFVIVTSDQPAAAAERIRDRTGLDVVTTEDIAANDRALLAGIVAAPLTLMVAVAFAAGTLLVALTVYSGVVERLAEYGIVKAMGATSGWLLRVVVGQTVTVALLGTVAGYGMFRAAGVAVEALRPQFSVVLPASAAAAVVASAAAMALLAGIVPVRRLARLDPASVYRGGA
jgi:putative ABC transport system permease protein